MSVRVWVFGWPSPSHEITDGDLGSDGLASLLRSLGHQVRVSLPRGDLYVDWPLEGKDILIGLCPAEPPGAPHSQEGLVVLRDLAGRLGRRLAASGATVRVFRSESQGDLLAFVGSVQPDLALWLSLGGAPKTPGFMGWVPKWASGADKRAARWIFQSLAAHAAPWTTDGRLVVGTPAREEACGGAPSVGIYLAGAAARAGGEGPAVWMDRVADGLFLGSTAALSQRHGPLAPVRLVPQDSERPKGLSQASLPGLPEALGPRTEWPMRPVEDWASEGDFSGELARLEPAILKDAQMGEVAARHLARIQQKEGQASKRF